MLTIDATDPKSGTAEFKATAVRIERIAGSVGASIPWTSSCPTRSRDEERDAVDALLGPPASGWAGGERARVEGRVAGAAARLGIDDTCCCPRSTPCRPAWDGSAQAASGTSASG